MYSSSQNLDYRQALKVVYSNIWISEIVRERVSDRRANHSKIPAAKRAETVKNAIPYNSLIYLLT